MSLLILVAGALTIWGGFHSRLLPFARTVVDARTAVVHPNPGFPLPAGIQAGDQVDLAAMDPETRYAIVVFDLQDTVTTEDRYRFAIRHGDSTAVVPVSNLSSSVSERARLYRLSR